MELLDDDDGDATMDESNDLALVESGMLAANRVAMDLAKPLQHLASQQGLAGIHSDPLLICSTKTMVVQQNCAR